MRLLIIWTAHACCDQAHSDVLTIRIESIGFERDYNNDVYARYNKESVVEDKFVERVTASINMQNKETGALQRIGSILMPAEQSSLEAPDIAGCYNVLQLEAESYLCGALEAEPGGKKKLPGHWHFHSEEFKERFLRAEKYSVELE